LKITDLAGKRIRTLQCGKQGRWHGYQYFFTMITTLALTTV
jgi:hypothetical protein